LIKVAIAAALQPGNKRRRMPAARSCIVNDTPDRGLA
jgi:hypothetical protein